MTPAVATRSLIACADIPAEHAYELVAEFERGHPATAIRTARMLIQTCEKVACVIAGSSLLITGERDEDFHRPAAILREAFGAACRLAPVGVRYRARRTGLEAPVLGVQVRCPERHLERVLRDLKRRGGEIVESSAEHGSGVIRAVVPAAVMVGYARQLAEATDGRGVHITWITRYAPLRAEPAQPAS